MRSDPAELISKTLGQWVRVSSIDIKEKQFLHFAPKCLYFDIH
jgi:hypothetical protein